MKERETKGGMRVEVMRIGREANEGRNPRAIKSGRAQEAMRARNGRRSRVYILYICSEGLNFYTLIGSVLEEHIDLLFTCHLFAIYENLSEWRSKEEGGQYKL